MRVRRLKKHVAELEVTAFINLIVVLVPFLLSTAVFSRLSVMDLTLPAQNNGAVAEQLKENDLKLEVIIRPDALDVGDRIGGLIKHIEHTPKGPNLAELSALIQQIKAKFPDKTSATVLAQPDTPYDVLVGVMDAVRVHEVVKGPQVTQTELFPDISIGDAPPNTPPGAAPAAAAKK